MAETRIIKRYANRKLYDTLASRYVTLDQISEMIRVGDDVKIVDNKTKEDLTTVTLAQIIFEEEKKQRSFLPLGAMRNIIQHGGEWIAEAQRKVSAILPGKRRDEPEAPPAVESAAETAEGTAIEKRETMAALRKWVEQSRGTLDAWQRRIDERLRGISPLSGVKGDVKALAERIAELETKLEQLAAADAAADEKK